MIVIKDIITDGVLESAYAWLCKRRQGYPCDADVWSFRRNWEQEKTRLKAELLEGSYRVSLLSRVTLKNQQEIDLWSARDALVLKALSLVLVKHLPISKNCAHIRGHGGAKGAVRQVLRHLPQHRFVLKTDVKSYYSSIDHFLVLDQLAHYIKDPRVLNLIGQYLGRCAERGGLYWEYTKGIALGCPLSPVLGAFFLKVLDEQIERLGLFYVRYMDDILVLAPTRWWLRKAVKVLNRVFATLRLEKHPDKTFIGKIERGFDFLGYHFSPMGLRVATGTMVRFIEHAIRLYEQEPGEPCGPSRLGAYVKHWAAWAKGGLVEEATH